MPCTALHNSFCLDNQGNVYPCLHFNVKLGNLTEQSMEEIWSSEKAKNVRKLIEGGVVQTAVLNAKLIEISLFILKLRSFILYGLIRINDYLGNVSEYKAGDGGRSSGVIK